MNGATRTIHHVYHHGLGRSAAQFEENDGHDCKACYDQEGTTSEDLAASGGQPSMRTRSR